MPNSSEVNPGDASSLSVPQFSTVEYAGAGAGTGVEHCGLCGNFLASEYYRAHGKMVCAACAQQVQNGQLVDSHSAFVRGLLLGIGAAAVGLAAYATFTIATGWYLGYIALGVGWFVAKAIQKGSGGVGGRRYQIAAVLLTYAAISMAAIPIGISYAAKHRHPAANPSHGSVAEGSAPGNADQSGNSSGPPRQVHAGALLGQLVLWGLASPFLELASPLHGAIGLFILFIGLRIAWRLTAARAVAVDGPFRLTTG